MRRRNIIGEWYQLFVSAVAAVKTKGLWAVIRTGAAWYTGYLAARVLHPPKRFTFQGSELRYFYHPYNQTWANERAVEVPVVWDFLGKHPGKRVLEVGNVLSHYFQVGHTVLDKYEPARGILNEDVVDFRPTEPYDIIVSISTLEHVGWDETPRDPPKVLRAVENMTRCLAPGGTMMVTLPIAYNSALDGYLKQGALAFTETHLFKRISKTGWKAAGWPEIEGVQFDDPFPYANALVIGVIRKQP